LNYNTFSFWLFFLGVFVVYWRLSHRGQNRLMLLASYVFYSWWDYRMLAFPKNQGLRIDHVLLSEPLAAKCKAALIDRNERKGKQPSDHAPVLVELDV